MSNLAYIVSIVALTFFSNAQIAKKVGKDFMDRFEAGQVGFMESDYYVKSNITGQANSWDLIKSSQNEQEGLTNIHNAKLKDGEHLALTGLVFGWSVSASNKPESQLYRTDYDSSATSKLDAALANARLVIRQGEETIFDMPVERLLSSTGSDRARENEGIQLDNVKLIEANKPFQIKLVFPEGLTVNDGTAADPDEFYHVNVQLKGFKTFRRA